MRTNISLKIIELVANIGVINADIPITTNILAILLPIMFPNTISGEFFIAALMETDSSGIEVPNPIITALISNLETQKLCANEMQPFNNIFPPRKRRTIPDNI